MCSRGAVRTASVVRSSLLSGRRTVFAQLPVKRRQAVRCTGRAACGALCGGVAAVWLGAGGVVLCDNETCAFVWVFNLVFVAVATVLMV